MSVQEPLRRMYTLRQSQLLSCTSGFVDSQSRVARCDFVELKLSRYLFYDLGRYLTHVVRVRVDERMLAQYIY